MNHSTILVIDDDLFTMQLISRNLTREGYLVLLSGNCTDALKLLDLYPVDLIMFNLYLQGKDSSIFYKAIKSRHNIPFILFKPKDNLNMDLPLLTSTSDDFMIKPFYPGELITRVKIALNHQLKSDRVEIVSIGPYRLNLEAKEIYCNNNLVDFSRREYDLLEYLVMHKNIVFTRNQLLKSVWGENFDGTDRTVDTHIKKIRQKVDPDCEFIKTIWGTGYKFSAR